MTLTTRWDHAFYGIGVAVVICVVIGVPLMWSVVKLHELNERRKKDRDG